MLQNCSDCFDGKLLVSLLQDVQGFITLAVSLKRC